MIVQIDVPAYRPGHGLPFEWEPGFEISARLEDDGVRIAANRAGLISLARHLLTLAGEDVPHGHHVHLDDSNSLDEGSCSVILEKC
jgi:hypothetical protein